MKIRYLLLIALVVTAPLSFHPSVSLPVLNFPSFRIGLYQILAATFVLSSLPEIINVLKSSLRNKLFLLLGVLFLAAMLVSIIQTSVPQRTLLYGGSFISLAVLGLTGFTVFGRLNDKQRKNLIYWLLMSGVGYGILAVAQLLLASFNVDTTLCSTCSDQVFGFPRINLFASEPQFFASSLLPIFFAALLSDQPKRLRLAALTLCSIALGLTFSRGAFFAMATTISVLVLLLAVRKDWAGLKSLISWTSLALAAIVFSFGMLVTSASILYRGTPHIAYNTAVSALEHMSLGLFSLSLRTEAAEEVAPQPLDNESAFTPAGLVEASTDDRLGAADLALDAWNDTPINILFGVSIGNLGAYVIEHLDPRAPSELTVYIFYILLISELGLVGLSVFISTAAILIWRLLKKQSLPLGSFLLALIFAFVIHFWFFGSYINVMYIYLWGGIGFALTVAPKSSRRRIPL